MTRVSLEEALAAAEEQPPAEGLRVVAAVRKRLETLEALHVERAIRGGWTWRRVAEHLGVSKQAAHKKHGRRIAEAAAAHGQADRKKLVVTGRARLCVRYAREEAAAVGARELRPEHLLLGLLRDDESVAAAAMTSAGLSLARARAVVGRGRFPEDDVIAPPEGPLPVGADARAALENSLREAVRRGDDHLGVEHLLLALLHEEGGSAAKTLGALRSDPAEVERELDRALAAAV
jgi:ATP-dependent Clp protease ATP-binding subunit ClpA